MGICLFYLCISLDFLQNGERTVSLLLLASLVSIFKPEESVPVIIFSRSRSVPFIIPPTLRGQDWIKLTNEEQVQEDSDPSMIAQSGPRSSFHSLGNGIAKTGLCKGILLKGNFILMKHVYCGHTRQCYAIQALNTYVYIFICIYICSHSGPTAVGLHIYGRQDNLSSCVL